MRDVIILSNEGIKHAKDDKNVYYKCGSYLCYKECFRNKKHLWRTCCGEKGVCWATRKTVQCVPVNIPVRLAGKKKIHLIRFV